MNSSGKFVELKEKIITTRMHTQVAFCADLGLAPAKAPAFKTNMKILSIINVNHKCYIVKDPPEQVSCAKTLSAKVAWRGRKLSPEADPGTEPQLRRPPEGYKRGGEPLRLLSSVRCLHEEPPRGARHPFALLGRSEARITCRPSRVVTEM